MWNCDEGVILQCVKSGPRMSWVESEKWRPSIRILKCRGLTWSPGSALGGKERSEVYYSVQHSLSQSFCHGIFLCLPQNNLLGCRRCCVNSILRASHFNCSSHIDLTAKWNCKKIFSNQTCPFVFIIYAVSGNLKLQYSSHKKLHNWTERLSHSVFYEREEQEGEGQHNCKGTWDDGGVSKLTL